MVQEKINRGRYTDHPAGCHSIWTNQYLHHPPFFTGRMPFLLPNPQCQSTEGTEGYHPTADLLMTPKVTEVWNVVKNELTEEAEKTHRITYIAKSNSLHRSAREESSELKAVDDQLGA